MTVSMNECCSPIFINTEETGEGLISPVQPVSSKGSKFLLKRTEAVNSLKMIFRKYI